MGRGKGAYRRQAVTASIIVQPEAEADLAEAFDWYERRRPGMGHDFLAEVDRVLQFVAENPLRTPQIWREARRALPRRFPYAVLYVLRGNDIYVIAVLHQRRDPRIAQARERRFRAG